MHPKAANTEKQSPPQPVHSMFVRCLYRIKGDRPEVAEDPRDFRTDLRKQLRSRTVLLLVPG